MSMDFSAEFYRERFSAILTTAAIEASHSTDLLRRKGPVRLRLGKQRADGGSNTIVGKDSEFREHLNQQISILSRRLDALALEYARRSLRTRSNV